MIVRLAKLTDLYFVTPVARSKPSDDNARFLDSLRLNLDLLIFIIIPRAMEEQFV